ncbi:hypothetical protein DSCO28_30810 [Desulfosarcina ovata subsp. sediminis]|uniref:histidine kinase n=1 Tax=Desulfosarcina ovata subsp. sediminis TaxID=885957 RepID=A0A5K7ZP47_9BACT|nr:ATP-binding protein [Desulfosarcina ovata]BBO82515.1 hypothetical protein DSCO28_30810 [Desulfosarcina ovata subsp. sediminis]
MVTGSIVLQSAGSLSVAVLALVMVTLQAILLLRTPHFKLCGWSGGISFAAFLYALSVFFEYNAPPGPVNRAAGLMEFTAILFLIHFFYGFSFSLFNIDGKRYHLGLGIFHLFIITLIWFGDRVVADRFVSRHFIGLSQPFIEPDLGPLGPVFVLYGTLSSLGVIWIWVSRKGFRRHYKIAFLCGMVVWILFGVHDGLAAMGMPTWHYLTEYGFLGFAAIVLWIAFSRFYEIASEDKYRTITEYATDGFLVIQDGNAVFENPACRELLGRSATGLPVEEFFDRATEKSLATIRKYFHSVMQPEARGEPIRVNLEKTAPTENLTEISANAICYKNRPAILAVLRDMTQRVRKERMLAESQGKIARLRKMEALGLLAGGVAHDLNNVLSGIVSYPDLLLMKLPPSSDLRKPILTMQESGKRAVAIVSDLLTVARGVAVERTVLNINRSIDVYLKSAEYEKLCLHHPHVKINAHLHRHLLNIQASPTHITKVIMNLVSNAAEAIMGNGSVDITTANRYVDRPLKGRNDIRAGEYVILTVADDGPGIGADDLERIFEPFFTKKVMGRSGTGLGLALVWNVIQDQGGHIDVTSDSHGTRFELYFPVTRKRTASDTPPTPLDLLHGHGERVLVVDDINSQREITCRLLEELGYTPQAASSGEAALDYIRTHGGVDLLVLDMIMDPGIDGYETYKRIKAIVPGQKAIIVSGYAETEPVKKAIQLGAQRYLRKPILIDALGQALKEAFAPPG